MVTVICISKQCSCYHKTFLKNNIYIFFFYNLFLWFFFHLFLSRKNWVFHVGEMCKYCQLTWSPSQFVCLSRFARLPPPQTRRARCLSLVRFIVTVDACHISQQYTFTWPSPESQQLLNHFMGIAWGRAVSPLRQVLRKLKKGEQR